MQSYTLNIRLFTHEDRVQQCIENLAPLEGCKIDLAHSPYYAPELTHNAHIVIIDSNLFDSAAIQQIYATDAILIICLEPACPAETEQTAYSFADEVWHLPLSTSYISRRLQHLRHELWHKHQADTLQIYLDAVIDTSPSLVWFKDTRGAHLKVNQAFCDATGKTKAQIEGRGHYYIWDIQPEEYSQGEYICFESEEIVLAKRERCLFKEQVKCKQGLRHFNTYKAPLIDANGTLLGTVGVAQDVSDCVEGATPPAVMVGVDSTLNIAHLHVWKLNLHTRVAELGSAFAKQLGLPQRLENYPECLIEQGVIDQESINACYKAHEMLIQGHTSVSYDALLIAPDGTELWRRVNYNVYSTGPSHRALGDLSAPATDPDHVILLGTSEDIDDYKRMEKYFSVAAAQNGIASWIYDIVNGCIYSIVTPNTTIGGNKQLIYTIPDFFINDTPLHKDDVDAVLDLHTKIAWGAENAEILTRWRGQSEQEWSWFKISYTTIFDVVGQAVRAIGSALDITEQVKAEHLYATQLAYRDNLTRDAVATLLLNLTANTVTSMRGNFCPTTDASSYRTVDDLFAAILLFTPAEDAPFVEKFYSRTALLQQFEAGQSSPSLSHLYGPSESKASWVKVTAHIIKNPDNNDVEAFVHVADIDTIKIIEASFSAVTSQEHDSVFAIDVLDKYCTHIYDKNNPADGKHDPRRYSYEDYVFDTYGDYVHKEDLSAYKQAMLLPVVLEGIAKNSVHSVFYRTTEGENLRHKRVQFGYISKPRQLIYMVISDITNAFEVEQTKNIQLSKALNAAKESSKAKTAFLANMSHEIRTPINTIIGMSEIMLAKQLDSEISSGISTIRTAGNGLLGIINDILDLSKVESGKFDINIASYMPSSLFVDVCNMISVRLVEKPIHFLITMNPELPARLQGDDTRIRQILTNIIGNAVKYTSQGYIILHVDGFYLPDGCYQLEMRVSDTGIGIKEEDIPLLFVQFNRVDTKRNRSISGTGLGLALSKQFAKLMGGDITVESSYGKGSTFTITLVQQVEDQSPAFYNRMEGQKILLYEPDTTISRTINRALIDMSIGCASCYKVEDIAAQSGITHVVLRRKFLKSVLMHLDGRCPDTNIILLLENDENPDPQYMQYKQAPLSIFCLQVAAVLTSKKHAIEQPTATPPRHRVDSLEGIRVLVVDDNTTNLQVAKGLLAPYKMTVETALNGYQAIEMVRRQHYDLIFMDHMMPGLDGVETTAHIRALPGEHFRTVPIIALTANAFHGAKESFISQGMTDFLAKPIEISKLDRMVKHYATPLLQDARARQINSPSNPSENTTAPLDDTADTNAATSLLLTSLPGIDMKRAIDVYGNFSVYQTILRTYCSDMETRVKELPLFIEQRDLKAFCISVHAIKSASRGVCAEALGDAAELLEELSSRGSMEHVLQHFSPFMQHLNTIIGHVQAFMKQWVLSDGTSQKQMCTRLDSSRVERLKLACQDMDYTLAETLISELAAFSYTDEKLTTLLKRMQTCCDDFTYTELDSIVASLNLE